MKRLLLGTCAVLMLAGCTTYGRAGGGIAYDGYYDDHYGPIYDGYWGDGDVFYYRSSRHGRYVRDNDHHFRRDTSQGFHQMHVTGPDLRNRHRPH